MQTNYSALLHSSMSTTDNTTYTVSQRTPDKEVRPKVKTIIFCHALFTTQSTYIKNYMYYINYVNSLLTSSSLSLTCIRFKGRRYPFKQSAHLKKDNNFTYLALALKSGKLIWRQLLLLANSSPI